VADEQVKGEMLALSLVLDHLYQEGLAWYQTSNEAGVAFYTQRLKATYPRVDRLKITGMPWAKRDKFPSRHIAFLEPPSRETAPILALWCRWDFEKSPADCGFYIGMWSKVFDKHGFVGFRFESPGEGDQHNYFHCQPCRNMGDKAYPEGLAVAISEFVPTFALHAANSVELALNIVFSMRGALGLQKFRRDLFENPTAANSPFLREGFARLLGLSVTADAA
jgi:hypothetical protein